MIFVGSRHVLSDPGRVASFLDEEFQETAFDVIAGNPPFGVVSLDPKERLRDRNCLEGPNHLYARFLVEALASIRSYGHRVHDYPDELDQ